MIEDEEAVDYGEDELSAPVTVQDEVSLKLEEDATHAEPAVAEISVKEEVKEEAEEHVTSKQEADVALEALLEQPAESGSTTAGDEADGPAQVKAGPSSTIKEEEKESTRAADKRGSLTEQSDAADSTAVDRGSDRRSGDDRKRDDKDKLPHGWITIHSRSGDGEVYYYNEETGESSWSKPTIARESRKAAPSDAKPASTANADQPRPKKKKKGKRARDAEKAKKAAAAARLEKQQQQQSSQRGRDGRDAEKSKQQEAGRKPQDASKDTSQGFSIKGSAQRQTEPSDSKPTNGASRSDGTQQRQGESNGKRKRGIVGGAQDNGGGRAKNQSDTAASSKNGLNSKSSGATSDAKRQRTDRDDCGSRDAPRAASNWFDDTPRDRRVGDSWRPGGDSARSAARYADDARWSDRRDAFSRDRQRESQRDATSASTSDRRRDTDARERDRDGRDDRRDSGRDREREREREQKSAPRNEAVKGSDQPNNGNSDSRASNHGNAASTSSEGKGNHNGRNANGNRTDRNGKNSQASHQQRQRGSKEQPRDLSSINSTNSQNKRQWGGGGAATASSKEAPSA